MDASQQHKVDNQPLVFSHHKAVVYPWNKVLVTRCSSSHQPVWIREEMLESGNLFSIIIIIIIIIRQLVSRHNVNYNQQLNIAN